MAPGELQCVQTKVSEMFLTEMAATQEALPAHVFAIFLDENQDGFRIVLLPNSSEKISQADGGVSRRDVAEMISGIMDAHTTTATQPDIIAICRQRNFPAEKFNDGFQCAKHHKSLITTVISDEQEISAWHMLVDAPNAKSGITLYEGPPLVSTQRDNLN